MTPPVYAPISDLNPYVLPETGSFDNVISSLSQKIYADSDEFISGAVAQVAYVYNHLGGEVLDLELTDNQVYESYESAVTTYSYLLNIHQGKNVLSNALGGSTASFDHKGEVVDGPAGVNLKYPQFDFAYARRIAEGISEEVGVGGTKDVYSASFSIVQNQQDYDLQTILVSASQDPDQPFYGKLDLDGNKTKIIVKKVYYKTPRATWRYFGFYGMGGLNTVGALSSYGQFASTSTFQMVPTWQNKLQAMAYEDALYTRLAHFSYELRNNKLRIFPIPRDPYGSSNVWVEFSFPSDVWEEDEDAKTGLDGVNNLNSLPFDNLPFEHINSIGQHWIRRYSLATSKVMLGHNRDKLSSIPIPNNEVTLNGASLVSEGREDQEKLKEELKTILDDLTYKKLIEDDAALVENAHSVFEKVPIGIYTG